jgi:hypothetical protein
LWIVLRQLYMDDRGINSHADETAALVTDDPTLQKIAASLDYPSLVLEMLHSIEQDSTIGRLSVDSVARGREVRLIVCIILTSGRLSGIDCIGFQPGINSYSHRGFNPASLDVLTRRYR